MEETHFINLSDPPLVMFTCNVTCIEIVVSLYQLLQLCLHIQIIDITSLKTQALGFGCISSARGRYTLNNGSLKTSINFHCKLLKFVLLEISSARGRFTLNNGSLKTSINFHCKLLKFVLLEIIVLYPSKWRAFFIDVKRRNKS